jgi:ANTAR domain-containing protein
VAVDESSKRIADANRLVDDEPRRPGAPTGTIGRLERLCSALSRALPAMGVGVSLLAADNYGGGTLAASDDASSVLEELQFSLGEGPCIDAYASRVPILEPDLAGRGTRRWPGYGPAARAHGVEAVFAFPLRVGAARAGALDVYRDAPGTLPAHGLVQAFTFAEVVMGLLLDDQHGIAGTQSRVDVDDVLAHRLEVYQAQGMLMVDLQVGVDEAMARLRAHAFAEGRALSDVANDIVNGRLTLERDTR